MGTGFVTSESSTGWRMLSAFEGTARKAAIVGRVASQASVVVGVLAEAYGAYKIYQAYNACSSR
jgi:hypothetical protein